MSIINTGLSGLLAFQRALNTTGHNIANASTEGYSRQRVELTNRDGQPVGTNYFGQGVGISEIQRLQSEFIDAEVRTAAATKNSHSTRADYAGRLDSMLADESTGLSTVLEQFFAAVQDFANDPTSTATAHVTFTTAESLVQRFNSMGAAIDAQRSQINSALDGAVTEVNDLATTLADLNSRIVAAYGATGGRGTPNDLLDQRGHILTQLAEKIDVRLTEQEDHAVNVFIGSGQALVLGTTANQLVAQSLSTDPNSVDIGLVSHNSTTPVNITRFMSGGEISGLLDARANVVDAAQSGLGLIALAVGTLVNQQNQLGLTGNGELGSAVFALPQPTVYAAETNSDASIPTVTLVPEAIGTLTASDYQLRYDTTTATYQLTRLQDNTVIANGVAGEILEGDGLQVDLSTITSTGVNDRWLIQPTRHAATAMQMVMTDASDLAPISGALADSNNKGNATPVSLRVTAADEANTQVPAAIVFNGSEFQVVSAQYAGTTAAKVTSVRITNPGSIDAATIAFNSATNSFQINGTTIIPLDSSGVTTISADGWEIKISGTPTDGDLFNVTLATAALAIESAMTTVVGDGWELDIYGTPTAGDQFSVQLSHNRVGDNRNMQAMAMLSEQRIVTGTQTLSDSYNTVVADVGTRTRQAQIASDAASSLFEDAQARRETESGVNLDEEAAALLRYQQAYQAAAHVISTGNAVFDILFSAV